jgi:Rhs element Vgr protein
MAESPIDANISIPNFSILIKGKEISNAYLVDSIKVKRAAYQIAKAHFSLILQLDKSEGKTFELSESDEFEPGNEVEIRAGYDEKSNTIFKGVITHHGLRLRAGDQILLEVSCCDKAILMTSGVKNAYFSNKKDSQLLAEIVNEYSLEKDIEATSFEHPLMVQYQATNWDFLVTRAQANGLLVSTDDGKLNVKKPKSKGSPVLTLSLAKDVIHFEAEMDTRDQPPAFAAFAWNDGTQKVDENQSDEPGIAQPGNKSGKKVASQIGYSNNELRTDAPLAKAQLKEWANAHLTRSRLSLLKGKVEFNGNHKPQVNSLVELKGFGKRFNGNALITEVYHRLDKDGWHTKVSFGLQDEWFYSRVNINTPPAGGLLPAAEGMHIGVVKKIHEDPGGAFRVLISLPNIEAQTEVLWARMAHLYATNGKGMFFYPEVSDEVLVAFINNDPRFPVILGKLYSKENAPPFTPDEKNQYKAIVSRSDIQMVFDDEKKILTLKTPGGHELTLSDEDKQILLKDNNGNKVELSDSGISLNSVKDVTISAEGKISIKAPQNIEIKSEGGDVALNGLGVKASAQTSLDLSGNASAQMKSSGNTVIKGAIVMIN